MIRKVLLWSSFFFFLSFFIFIFYFSFFKIQSLLKIKELNLIFEVKQKEDLERILPQFKSLRYKARLQNDLKKQLQVFKGRYLWQVPLSNISKHLKRDPRIESVSISRKFPNRFLISFQIHIPILALLDEKGEFHFITKEAHFFPFSKDFPGYWNVPLLRGKEFLRDIFLRKKAVSLLMSLPLNGLLSRFSVSEIWLDEEKNFSFFLDSLNIEVRFGKDQFPFRSRFAEFVLNNLRSRNLQGRVIDVRFSKKVVVSLSKPS